MTTPARSRTITWTDPLDIATASRASSGREFLQSMIDGKVPAPPIALALGFRIVEVGDGFAAFEYEPHEMHYNPLGGVHGGVPAAVFDAALGCAIHTKLPQGTGYTTLQLATNFVRPILATTGTLRCEARVLHVGRSVATSEATLRDRDGKLYAHATTTCMVLK